MGIYLSPSLFNGFLLSNQTSFQFSIYNLSVHSSFKQALLTVINKQQCAHTEP